MGLLDIGNLIGGIAGAGASAYAAKKNLQAVRETNQANKDIAKANNEWNRQSAELQNTWNLQQWERENAYNSASAQADRFREAGLNPYLAMTGGADAGTAQSQSAADIAPASDVGKQMPADYSGYMEVGRQLASIPSAIAQTENLGSLTDKQNADAKVSFEQAKQLGIENSYRDQLHNISIRKMIADLDVSEQTKKNLLEDWKMKQRDNDMLDDYEVSNARKQEYVQKARLLGSMSAVNEVKKLLDDKELKWFDTNAQLKVKSVIANCAAASAAANLSNQQAEKVYQEGLLVAFDNRIRDAIGMKGINRLAWSLVNQTYYGINKDKVMSENLGSLWDSEIFRNYAGAAGEAVGGFFNVFGGSETTNMDWNDFGNQTGPNGKGGKTHRGYTRRNVKTFKRFKFNLPKFGK